LAETRAKEGVAITSPGNLPLPQPGKPTLIAATSDLFIQSRLTELANSLGLEARFATGERELIQLVASHPRLMILDLSSSDYDPTSLVKALKANSPGLRILGFYPHVRKDLEAKARGAGVDFIVPNSSFLRAARQALEQKPS
jgi:CheY-like chemotaxis protein